MIPDRTESMRRKIKNLHAHLMTTILLIMLLCVQLLH